MKITEPKFNIGDYVKWEEVSKGGKIYFERGTVIHIDSHPLISPNFILYYILREDNEELSKIELYLKADAQTEREVKLNRLL